MQVLVRDNNVDQALKALKKKMQREGIFREMKLRGHYEKPSEKRAREKAEAVRRAPSSFLNLIVAHPAGDRDLKSSGHGSGRFMKKAARGRL